MEGETMDEPVDIDGNARAVLDRVAAAARRAGRDPGGIRLMAVSKFHPIEEIDQAYRAGLRLFGENRVREAEQKYDEYFSSKADAELRLIGSLQSNKAKAAARVFSGIDSVDSFDIAQRLSRHAAELGKTLGLCLELHTAEDSKAGFPSEDSLLEALGKIIELPNLRPQGLMTMAPFTQDEGAIRASFKRLFALARRWEREYPRLGAPILSMGMSNDFEIAIEEGSDLVRVGTAIFGERRT
jgi:pyridoxal phosphate enzyme (YggS family)